MNRCKRKKLSFLLLAFFILSYQHANYYVTKTNVVEAANNMSVVLGGQSIGVDVSVNGVMVLGMSDFCGEDGKMYCPAKKAGIRKGDIITSVNNKNVTTATEFSNAVDMYEGVPMDIEYTRDGQTVSTVITAVKALDDGKYHLGLWARDGTTGIGTLTFINPENESYGALGHGITDIETDMMINPCSGNIYFSSISGVQKGSPANPGELKGYFISTEIGDVTKNTEHGIFGNFNGTFEKNNTVCVASKHEISSGNATILCCIEGNTVEEFAVKIEKININSKDNKSMVIRITDEKLLKSTGGIVQGMSGSPIVQNGKLVGAVTHVFVNDPTRGYGIFIENMLENTE